MKRILLVIPVFLLSFHSAKALTYEELKQKLTFDNTPVEDAAQTRMSYAPVVEKILPSVVSIFTTKEMKVGRRDNPGNLPFNDPLFRRFFGLDENDPRINPGNMPPQKGLGSGVLITSDGYILTNNHVIAGADEIKVYLSAMKKEFLAKVVGTDPKTDVALIKIQGENLPHATLTDSTRINVGDIVLAIGTPFELEQTVTMGIVSALGRSNIGVIRGGYENFIQTDASINPGNSGGALVDAKGRVVGINTAIASNTGSNNGIGFAIPVNMALTIVGQLLDKGRVERGYLGIVPSDLTDDLARYHGLSNQQGALVEELQPNSPANAAGIREGDVITHLNNEVVVDASKLRLMVSNMPPGTKVVFTVVRDGKTSDVAVTLEALPEDGQIGGLNPAPNRENLPEGELLPGLKVAPIGDQQNGDGLVITDVAVNTPSSGAGLRPGQVITEVNRTRVNSLAQARNALDRSRNGRHLLRIQDGDSLRYVAVED